MNEKKALPTMQSANYPNTRPNMKISKDEGKQQLKI
jgi:hypothetical protein